MRGIRFSSSCRIPQIATRGDAATTKNEPLEEKPNYTHTICSLAQFSFGRLVSYTLEKIEISLKIKTTIKIGLCVFVYLSTNLYVFFITQILINHAQLAQISSIYLIFSYCVHVNNLFAMLCVLNITGQVQNWMHKKHFGTNSKLNAQQREASSLWQFVDNTKFSFYFFYLRTQIKLLFSIGGIQISILKHMKNKKSTALNSIN